jgi:Putative peptidoglycan binding domain
MRTFLILICSFLLVCSAGAAQNDNKSKKQAQKRTQAQPTQYRAKTSGPKTATPKHYQTTARTAAPKRYQPAPRTTSYQKTKGRQQVNSQAYQSNANLKRANSSQQIAAQRTPALNASQKTKRSQQITAQRAQTLNASQKTKRPQQTVAAGGNAGAANYSKKTKQWKSNTAANARFQSNTKTYKARHFNLASNTRSTKFTSVKFQQNRRIQGSQYWQGKNYWAFRNYRPVWHDRIWWRNHYNRVVFVYGGWYYWNAGWWYPAWGYAPNAYYAYDGPIYGYNSLPPDQVIANVQAALQEQGYYQGGVDGLLGPLTREAIAGYQRDHGLYETAAIDQPTLESLGMT